IRNPRSFDGLREQRIGEVAGKPQGANASALFQVRASQNVANGFAKLGAKSDFRMLDLSIAPRSFDPRLRVETELQAAAEIAISEQALPFGPSAILELPDDWNGFGGFGLGQSRERLPPQVPVCRAMRPGICEPNFNCGKNAVMNGRARLAE